MHQNAISRLHLWNKQQMASLSWLAELEPKGISQSRSDFPNMTTQHEKCASNIERLRALSPSLPHSLQQWPKLGGRLSTYPEILLVIGENLHMFSRWSADIHWYTILENIQIIFININLIIFWHPSRVCAWLEWDAASQFYLGATHLTSVGSKHIKQHMNQKKHIHRCKCRFFGKLPCHVMANILPTLPRAQPSLAAVKYDHLRQ
jgi:hypothetical protein